MSDKPLGQELPSVSVKHTDLPAQLRKHASTGDGEYWLRYYARQAATVLETPQVKYQPRPWWQLAAGALASFLAGIALMVGVGLATGSDGVHCSHNQYGQKACWWRVP